MIAALLANAAGWQGDPGPGSIYMAVLWTIVLAAVQFFRLLFAPMQSSGA